MRLAQLFSRAFVIATIAFSSLAQAQDFPQRPIRLVIGYSPGGSTDAPFRALAEAASKILGQPVVVENRVGAGGTMPAQTLFQSKPDGYTIAQFAGPVFRQPFMMPTAWNPATDFEYVIAVNAFAGSGLVVRADAPWKTIKEFIAHAKANPDKVTYGTPGRMTALHLIMEDIQRATGTQLVHVPYKGDAESLPSVLGGHVMAAAATASHRPYVEAGKLRLLLTFDDEADPRYPGVPSVVEAGLAKPDRTPLGIAVRKGTDPRIVAKLHDAFRQAMDAPEFKDVLRKFDMKTAYMSSADYTAYVSEKLKREKVIVETYGAK